jgi:hypothetical protein
VARSAVGVVTSTAGGVARSAEGVENIPSRGSTAKRGRVSKFIILFYLLHLFNLHSSVSTEERSKKSSRCICSATQNSILAKLIKRSRFAPLNGA